MSNFDCDPLTFDQAHFLTKNSQNSAKSNHIFPEKLRLDRALILQYSDSSMAKYCHWKQSVFSISASFMV